MKNTDNTQYWQCTEQWELAHIARGSAERAVALRKFGNLLGNYHMTPQSFPWVSILEKWKISSHKNLFVNVYSSSSLNLQNLAAGAMPVSGWLDGASVLGSAAPQWEGRHLRAAACPNLRLLTVGLASPQGYIACDAFDETSWKENYSDGDRSVCARGGVRRVWL